MARTESYLTENFNSAKSYFYKIPTANKEKREMTLENRVTVWFHWAEWNFGCCTPQDGNRSGIGLRYVPEQSQCLGVAIVAAKFWFQKKVVEFWQSVFHPALCLEILEKIRGPCASISSEFFVMCSSLVLEAFVSQNKLFLGCSSWLCILSASNFLFFVHERPTWKSSRQNQILSLIVIEIASSISEEKNRTI